MSWSVSGALLTVCGFGALKVVAYVGDMLWFFSRGSTVLLEAYKTQPIRTYEADQLLGRPRLFSRRAVRRDASLKWRIWGVLFKTPTVVVVMFVGITVTAPAAMSGPLVAAAVIAGMLGVLILVVPVVMRLTLGPYDVLNPDLQLPARLKARVYDGSRNSLSLYILVLIAMTLVAFASAYDALGAIPGVLLRGGGSSADPIRWTFSALAVSATEGFGDIVPGSDGVRVLLSAQMLLGPVVLAWVASTFFGDRLPEAVLAALDGNANESPTADRLQAGA